MSEITLAIFDPNITEKSPAGSCLLKMLRAAAESYRLEVFATRTDLHAAERVVIHTIPVPMWPVFLQSICFTAASVLFDFFTSSKQNTLKIGTQGGFPFCDISYAHCCHKLFLTRYQAHITGGFFTRAARLLNHRWNAAMEGAAFKHARVIVAPSEGLADELTIAYGTAIGTKLRVLANPVDCQAFSPRQSATARDAFTFAFCALGNFEWKGLSLILEALATGISAQLQVIGGGPAEVERFRGLAEAANIADRVNFVGLQSDIRPYLWACDAFVFPSVHETFPLVCLQAAAAGLPIIATGLHGLEKLLLPGISGWRVERSIESLSSAMRAAVADREKTRAMGGSAKTLAQEYDEPVFQRRWLELLAQTAAKP